MTDQLVGDGLGGTGETLRVVRGPAVGTVEGLVVGGSFGISLGRTLLRGGGGGLTVSD
jgi:hypothetical protein